MENTMKAVVLDKPTKEEDAEYSEGTLYGADRWLWLSGD